MKPSPLCHQLFDCDDREHLCMLRKGHGSRCKGHETSRDLVPEFANKITMPFIGAVFFWESEDIPGVWLAYVNPPFDLMTQGKRGGGHDSALKSLMRMIRVNRLLEEDYNLHE